MADSDDGTGPLVVRSEFSTTDADAAEEFLDVGYTAANKLTITGIAEDFTFTHSAVTAPRISINRLRIGVDFIDDAYAGPDDAVTAIQVLGGRLSYVGTAYPEVHGDVGDVLMLPLTGPVCGIAERCDLAMVQLDRPALVAYATAMTGLDPDQLRFDDITPLTPGLGDYWAGSVARIRDTLLADPGVAGNPILLDQVFRSLAAGLLSTFPNTALARAVDPETAPERGDVSAATLREVIEYLDAHADEPIGPVTIAELTALPAVDVVEGLRRQGSHPAELLWRARLRGVRQDLLDADPTVADVAALAARWGFAHLGRFRVAYLHAFDEAPEQTLRR